MTNPTASDDSSQENNAEDAQIQSGIIQFYGLYWKKKYFKAQSEQNQLLGIPFRKTGRGKYSPNAPRSDGCLNFWEQKGVYILYNSDLIPVYAGQAGGVRNYDKNKPSGLNGIGRRLRDHANGKYKHGWKYFSWFGFLDTKIKETRNTNSNDRMNVEWIEGNEKKFDLNSLLNSMEAIVIEGFIPRFNARGGDLKGAHVCSQYEDAPLEP